MKITNKSGIYTITNRVNKKIYVGFATNIKSRITYHKNRLKSNTHDNEYLQRAINKYGIENFDFEVLEECSVEFLASQENYWGNILNTTNRQYGYNIQLFNPDGRYKSNPESIEKQRSKLLGKKTKPHTMESKKKMSKALKGRVVSEETKEKLRIIGKNKPFNKKAVEAMQKANLGSKKLNPRKGFKCSKEHKNKIKEGLSKPIIQFLLNGQKIGEWGSATKVKEVLGYDNSNIVKCCKGKQKKAYGFIWKYKTIIN